jgi:deoxyribodipyrimidine photo-lyase
MSRDQRVQDNWALLYAQKLALKQKLPLYVCFSLVPTFLGATLRHYSFLLEGLREVEKVFKLGVE